MRKQAPRHLAPTPRRRPTRGIAAGVVGTVVVGLGVYGLSQSTAASGAPVVEVTTQPVVSAAAPAATTTASAYANSAVAAKSNPVAAPVAPASSAAVTPTTTASDLPAPADDLEVAEELVQRQDALAASSKKVDAQAERLAGTFIFPSEGKPGSPWGMRLHPILHVMKMHAGVDIGASCGTPIVAVLDGTVTNATFGSASGNHVQIDHGVVNGKQLNTDSLHMTKYVVATGDTVKRGQLIGYIGSTGRSTECHLHFELYVDGKNSDPAPFLTDADKFHD